MTSKESFKTLELTNTTNVKFPDDDEYRFKPVSTTLLRYTFLSIEVQSTLPPTECFFTFRFCTHQNNSVRTMILHSMECRKDFIFENGLYILYLDVIKIFCEDLTKDLVPLDFTFTNKRDINSSAKLFYKVTFDV
jgi:hypothetical protein